MQSNNQKKRTPTGRTLSTCDKNLPIKKGKSEKLKDKRTVVIIEVNEDNEFDIVPLSGSVGHNKTKLNNYQQGNSYFKHFVEIEDSEGMPIQVNSKFRENHKNRDVSQKDILIIRQRVLKSSKPAPENRKKLEKFRGKKNPRD